MIEQNRDTARATIVDAAAHLLRENGSRAVTTRAVADAAGVQAPTIYRLFGDKDGLIDAVAEKVMADYVATKNVAADDQSDPLQAFRVSWHAHIEFSLANPDLYAILNAPGRLQTSPATAAGADVLHARIHNLARAGLLRVSEQRALDLFRAAGNGAISVLLSVPAQSRDAGLAEALFDAVVAQAIVGGVPPADRSTLSTTVAFATVVAELPGLSDSERALLAEWAGRSIAALHQG